MEGKLHQVPEEACERSADILQNIFHWAQAITSVSDDLVRRLLHREY